MSQTNDNEVTRHSEEKCNEVTRHNKEKCSGVTRHKGTSQKRSKRMAEEKPVGYEKLIVWQKADELAMTIYRATRDFPREEMYGITSQLRRAALSVPLNIVEGTGRQGKRELKQFLNVALGSLNEVDYLLGFCHRLGYVNRGVYEDLEGKRADVGRLLWKFYLSIS